MKYRVTYTASATFVVDGDAYPGCDTLEDVRAAEKDADPLSVMEMLSEHGRITSSVEEYRTETETGE